MRVRLGAPARAASACQARRAQAGCERRKLACSAGTARRLIQHQDGGLQKPSRGVGCGDDALGLGHEHADEGVQVAGQLLLVVPAELAAEHLRCHLDQLACGCTAQPLAGKKEGSGATHCRTGKNREKFLGFSPDFKIGRKS